MKKFLKRIAFELLLIIALFAMEIALGMVFGVLPLGIWFIVCYIEVTCVIKVWKAVQ